MKDAFQIFDEYFPKLIVSLEQLNFQSCTSISSDLVKVSEMIDYTDGIFVSEILESTFNQLNFEFMRYEILPATKESIKVSLVEDLHKISEYYKESDKNNLYDALKNLRADATKFQFQIRRQARPLPQQMQIPMPFIR